MVKEFDELVIWQKETKGGFNSSEGEISLQVIEKSIAIDTDCIECVKRTCISPYSKHESDKLATEYLELENLEVIVIFTTSGVRHSNILKPKNVSMKQFVFGKK